MPRRVRDALTDPRGKLFHAPVSLRDVFEQFEPMGMTERLSDLGKTVIDRLLGAST